MGRGRQSVNQQTIIQIPQTNELQKFQGHFLAPTDSNGRIMPQFGYPVFEELKVPQQNLELRNYTNSTNIFFKNNQDQIKNLNNNSEQ